MGAPASVRPWRTEEFEERVATLERQVAELMELKTANPRRVFMTDVVKWRLAAALPDLQRQNRGYVTVAIVAKHFDFPLDTTRIGIRKAVDAGKVKIERVHGRHDWIILLPDQPMPAPTALPLSKTQMGVLIDLRRLAKNGTVTLSNNALGYALSRCPTTVNYAMRRLIIAGHIRVLERGQAGRASTYFIPSAIK